MTATVVSIARVRAVAWRRAIGHRLREERTDQGLRLVDVAGTAGVSAQYLSEVERGRKEASSQVIVALTGALGLTLADLAGGLASDLARAERGLSSAPEPARRTPGHRAAVLLAA